MDNEHLERREFLRLAVATVAATALSHFRLLNPGSGVVLAEPEGWCEGIGGLPEYPDVCAPAILNPDICALLYDPDECTPDPANPGLDPDVCAPGRDPDVCEPGTSADICYPPNSEPDETPTAVDLMSFTATPAGNAIRLDWVTVTELDSLGFHLYRANSLHGTLTQLNESLIPCQSLHGPVGAAYTFLDEAVIPGVSYYYWLDDVDVYGVAARHGPVAAALPRFRRLPSRQRPAPRTRP
jgi:hypothetical protein